MTRYTQHRILDNLLNALGIIILWQAGAGYWSLIVPAYGVWCFYDGLRRIHLHKEHEAIKNFETTYRQTSNETTK